MASNLCLALAVAMATIEGGKLKAEKKQHLRQVKTEGHLAQHSKTFGMLFFSEKNSQKIACHFRKSSQKKKIAEICCFFLKNSRKIG